jgi:hypothetical protein
LSVAARHSARAHLTCVSVVNSTHAACGPAQAREPVADRIAAMGDFLCAGVAAARTYRPAGRYTK